MDEPLYGVGAVLFVEKDGVELSVYYASRSLTTAEQKLLSNWMQSIVHHIWSVKIWLVLARKKIFAGPWSQTVAENFWTTNCNFSYSNLKITTMVVIPWKFWLWQCVSNIKRIGKCRWIIALPTVKPSFDTEVQQIEREAISQIPINAADVRKETVRDSVLSRILRYGQLGWSE